MTMRSWAHTLALLASLGPLPAELVGRPERTPEQSDEQRERAVSTAEAKRKRRRRRNREARHG